MTFPLRALPERPPSENSLDFWGNHSASGAETLHAPRGILLAFEATTLKKLPGTAPWKQERTFGNSESSPSAPVRRKGDF